MYATTWRLWIFLRWATYPQSQRMFNAVRKCKKLIQLEKRGIICSKPLYTWCLWRGLERLRVSASCRARGTRNSPKQIFRHKVRYIYEVPHMRLSAFVLNQIVDLKTVTRYSWFTRIWSVPFFALSSFAAIDTIDRWPTDRKSLFATVIPQCQKFLTI